MGVVYSAKHELLNNLVALKLLLPEIAKDKEAVTRFLNEGRATARLQSSHVVRVMDVGMSGSSPFMVMELLAGEDLAQLLEKRGKLKITETVDFLIEAMEGLSHAHTAGIVHRDLQPSNLFLAEGEEDARTLKVVDFGISKTMGTSGSITSTAAVLGSPAYMAPEQLRSSKRVDARADIWSLGVIAFELLTGQLPFGGETIGEIFANVLEKTPPRPRQLREEIPGKLEEVVMRCLEKSPDARFPNVGELAGAISRFGTGRCDALVAAIEKKLGALGSGVPPVRSPSASVPDLELVPRAVSVNAPTISASSSGSLPAVRSKPEAPVQAGGFGAFDWEDDVASAPLMTIDEVAAPRSPVSKPVAAPPKVSSPPISGPKALPPAVSSSPKAIPSSRARDVLESDAMRTLAPVIVNGFVALLVTALLWRFVPSSNGWKMLAIMPSATDGTSIGTSIAFSVVFALSCLGAALTGLLGHTRRWALIVAAIGLLVMTIGMLIVTASTTPAGQIGPKPSGGFLVPIGATLLFVGGTVMLLGRARERWLDGDRGVSTAMAAVAGALLYVGIQLFAGALT